MSVGTGRFYIDPDDEYHTEVLVPAIEARAEKRGTEIEVIELDRRSYPSSTRAREDGIEPSDTPAYVYREGDIVGMWLGSPDVRDCVDPETHDRLAYDRGYLDEQGVIDR